MHYGYARVSTPDQKLDLQVDALKKAGCETIYKEEITGYHIHTNIQTLGVDYKTFQKEIQKV